MESNWKGDGYNVQSGIFAKMTAMNDLPSVVERFLRYVKIDTQSDPHSDTIPSTEKQKNLSRILVAELLEMGLRDAAMDENGYVYATLPANTDKQVPTICFCSHVDTSPESSGANVQPQIHTNYQGQVIELKDDVRINPSEHPELATKIGRDIITSDGTTLLGADNKAGVAEIMEMAARCVQDPSIKHGKIRLLFTPDEEIGRGAHHVDLGRLNADFGYTVDGEALGSFEDETFSADMAVVTFKGVNTHPGFAKGQMESALKAACEFIALLPNDSWSPETTSGREGFVHPYEMKGGVEEASCTFIIRSFEDEELVAFESRLKALALQAGSRFPSMEVEMKVTEQYRNMKAVISKHPQISDFAKEAILRAGLELKEGCIRGGTDGSILSYRGLPCANIFAGEHAFHSKMEWTTVQDMEDAVTTLLHLIQIWEERS